MAVALLGALVLLARGRYDTVPDAVVGTAAASAWSDPCRGAKLAGGNVCERVRGRVVFVERLPSIGSRVEATGPTVVGSSRRKEIQAERFRDLGRSPG